MTRISVGKALREVLGGARLVGIRIASTDEFEREQAGFALLNKFSRWACPSYVLTDYGKSWFRDVEFRRAYDRLIPDGNYRSADRKYFLRSLLHLVEGLPGGTAECGVWEGASSWFICDHFKGSGKTHHGFDSFEGLSEPSPADGRYWQRGDLRSEESTARKNLAGFDVKLYPGWIPERFDEVRDVSFCFVHVDVDLYEPTLRSAEFFYPRMVPGGILLFDDYGFDTCPGATAAVDEAMAGKPETLIRAPTGQAFAIKS